ncbi:cytochrome P450, partial [Kalaharituber pfeilii]
IPSAVSGLPLIGNITEYSSNPIEYLKNAKAKYGKFFEVNMLFTNTIWLMGSDMNKLYTEKKEDVWSFGGGMGLFLNKVVVPGYFSNLKTFVNSVNRGVNRPVALRAACTVMDDQSKKTLGSWTQDDKINLFEAVSLLVHQILTRCLMGEDFFDHHFNELNHLLHEMERDIGHVFNFILPEWVPHPPARRLRAARDRVVAIFQERLSQREKEPERWANSEDYISYTLRDPATAHISHLYPAHHTLLMFAAHTSTVANISWTIIELMRNPSRINILKEEMDRLIPPGTSFFETYARPAMLQSALRESGRHYSGINMLRLSREPVQLPSGISVPQNTVVSISPYLTHHDPALYPNPQEWMPERFIENPDLPREMNKDGKVSYLPFGAGAHRCPGEKFANMLASIAVGMLIRDYEVSWPKGLENQNFSELDFNKIGAAWSKNPVYISVK